MTHSVLGVLLIQILISCQIGSIQSAPLSSYLVSSFTPPDSDFKLPFNHIAFNNITGDIYIGARERLYQLGSDLNVKQTVNTGKCQNDEGLFNDNKLLIAVVTPQKYTLVACGGCDVNCQTRDLANISLDQGYSTDTVVATGDNPTVGVVAFGFNVNCQTDERDTLDEYLYLYTGISGKGKSETRFISKLTLSDLSIQQYIPIHDITSDIRFTFKHVISYKDYIYYFISRKQNTYLGGFCRKTLDCEFESYTEIMLQCEPNNDMNEVIQSAQIGPAGSQLAESMNINSTDDLLYVAFSSTSSFSLCVYKMIDVQQRFDDAILGCILGTGTGTTNTFLERQNEESKCGQSGSPGDLFNRKPDKQMTSELDGMEPEVYKNALLPVLSVVFPPK
ncbi:plexin-A4-like [Lytechinus pictus]|uniref:plexin-A4-like n=1 Tax=Lytechinus pictus TaxID=7653 RepID=UPI0030BA24E9